MKHRIIDTHCHPQFPQYDRDRPEMIRRALGAGIGMICVGTDLDMSRKAVELADMYEGVYATVGIHPNHKAGENHDVSMFGLELESLARQTKVVAIGEIGLDYYRTPDPKYREAQVSLFASQLGLAHSLGLPAIIHCRDAHEDLMRMLSEHGSDLKGMQAVIHSFNGTVTQARTYLEGGFYIGLNAIVTFSKNYLEMVRFIPEDRLLLETDAPYLAPEPHRGKRNEPHYIEGVGNLIADIRGMNPETLFTATTGNARTLFRL